jgi:cystathionine beta-lyase/cystathionine gamma-synthase
MARFSTRAILAATRSPEVNQIPSAVPIYQAAAFSTADAAELGDVLTGARSGYAYSRIDNPTTAALGSAVAELEGAEAGLAFATGMAAIHAALVSVVQAGQTIVSTQAVYGTTRDLLVRILARFGVATEFVDPTDLAAVEAALVGTGSPVLYVETISNPTIIVSDISALAEIAHRHGALLLVDNTFASPFACRPLERGADIVIHSATKYLSGHADVLAGVVVGSRERVDACRPILIDVGGALAPLAAFLVLRGIPTLELRMRRHSETALELAAWLEGQDGVERVHYPGLPGNPQHSLAVRQLDVFGGMLAFELSGGRAAGAAFLDAMTVAERTASLGAFRTITTHSASTTHRQLDADALRASGIAPGLLRCSVGLEDVEDLREDFERGLAAAGEAVEAQ